MNSPTAAIKAKPIVIHRLVGGPKSASRPKNGMNATWTTRGASANQILISGLPSPSVTAPSQNPVAAIPLRYAFPLVSCMLLRASLEYLRSRTCDSLVVGKKEEPASNDRSPGDDPGQSHRQKERELVPASSGHSPSSGVQLGLFRNFDSRVASVLVELGFHPKGLLDLCFGDTWTKSHASLDSQQKYE